MSKIFNLPPKIQQETDIILPPNFEMFNKDHEKVEELQLNLPPRLGENNPLIFPSLQSHPISFENSEMTRLNLENLLNPHQNDIEFMEKELNEYRQQVLHQNDEFKRLEKERNEVKSMAPQEQSVNYDVIRQQNQIRQNELMAIQQEKERLLQMMRQRQVQTEEVYYPPQENVQRQEVHTNASPYDDFFDRPEVIHNDNAPSKWNNQPQIQVRSMNESGMSSNVIHSSQGAYQNRGNPVQFVNQQPSQGQQVQYSYQNQSSNVNQPQYANQVQQNQNFFANN